MKASTRSKTPQRTSTSCTLRCWNWSRSSGGVSGLRIPDTLTLAKLDRVIQTVLGWTNSHLHEFEIEGQRYGMVPDEFPDAMPTKLDRNHRLGDVLQERVKGFSYTYDFGDNWCHVITVEKTLVPDDEVNTWPICLGGQHACPPEDVGGIGGYIDFVEAMQDPEHDEHRALWRWHGGPFDPYGFDMNAANRALQRLR